VATQREIKKRIESVKSTKKITKTMEMVSTAKMKKMQGRLLMSQPFVQKLNQVIANLRNSGVENIYDPLMQEWPESKRTLVFTVTGNRGLCGGFNNNVINNTIAFKKRLEIEEGRDVQIYAIGKKAIGYFNFTGQPMYKSSLNMEDKVSFAEAAKIAQELINLYEYGEAHEVYLSYTKVVSASSQKPVIVQLLPIKPERVGVEDVGPEFTPQYIFEPNPYRIFSSLLPLYVKAQVFLALLESNFSEQFARRVSMKNATDAATDMIRDLTITYNRARQAKITTEIAEIVGGAAALG